MAKKTHKFPHGLGTVYQKEENGNFYLRYQENGRRKAVSLNTRDFKTAVKVAEDKRKPRIEQKSLKLSEAWTTYESHPNRATPATVHEENSYRATWREFVEYVPGDPELSQISQEMTEGYAKELRNQPIAVDTHNRKIKRLRRVFEALQEFYEGKNPFEGKLLRRTKREEQENTVRRKSFTKELELEILRVLDDDNYKVINKPEIRTLFYLGMFTGQRLKDCALLQWDRVNLNRKRIWVRQFKTGKEVTIPIASQLLSVLQDAEKSRQSDYVLPNVSKRYLQTDKNGKNTGSNLVNIDTLRVIRWIGLEPSIDAPGRKRKVTVYGFHSLRHSFASHCAEAGVPKAVVLSILGAASEIVDKHYVHIGEEAQLQALDAVSLGSDSPKETASDMIARAIEYIDGLPSLTEELETVKNLLTQG